MDSFIINSLTTPQTGLTPLQSTFLAVMFIWSIAWKGVALWHASKNNDKLWFVALLVLNTVGLVEIIYLFFVAKNRLTPAQVQSALKALNFRNIKEISSSKPTKKAKLGNKIR